MSLDLDDCTLSGAALTPLFLREGLKPPRDACNGWETVRTSLGRGGPQRVHRKVMTPLARALGYQTSRRQDPVLTREGEEDGGWLLAAGRVSLRAWSIGSETDLDHPDRHSPTRSAQRVLLATGEQAGLQTNGEVLRLLLCDLTRGDSFLSIPIDGWPRLPDAPDSFRVLATLASARTLPELPRLLDGARLYQAKVTSALRGQARDAVTAFINNLPRRDGASAGALWREGLILIYRLLFILKLESPTEAGGGFSFASSRLWRTALSPNRALAPLVRRHLDHGHDTGRMLEFGLRSLFAAFRDGLSCAELRIASLGGALFGEQATPLLDRLEWGDRAVALLLDRLIWTGDKGRQRVHYGSLDVEDLGSIYEGLLELEPAIATEPLIRLLKGGPIAPAGEAPPDIGNGDFFLCASTGRKASGSFYTPREFVRFLVRETLEPKIAALSPSDDPQPAALLSLRIVDPATGSGHFLVETCRYLGEALLNACLAADERGLTERIAALPDPDNTLAPYLPSRGYDEPRARAICRRLVAVHCLYGCDRNALAIELAKLALWLESWAEGLPLTFLDHRLVHGDALSGPFFDSLLTLPVTGGPLDPLLAQDVARHLTNRMRQARQMVRDLDASIGRDVADLADKQALKIRLDDLLRPLCHLARSWCDAAMARRRDGDDRWLALARCVVETGSCPEGTESGPAAGDALPWDLIFPDVFPGGFDVVLGNPPWDAVQPNIKDFIAAYDPAVLDARTVWERSRIEQSVLARPGISQAFAQYREGFERTKRIARRLYPKQRGASGNLDLFRLFAERAMQLTRRDGAIGLLLPAAFHANEGAAPIRRLYLEQADLAWCLSFENRRRLFDIDSRFKFDAVVARRPGPTKAIRCGFYLERMADAADSAKIMTYSPDFLRAAGGRSLTPLELRGTNDLLLAERLFGNTERLGDWCDRRGIRFGCDLHMTADSSYFLPAGQGELVVHEGKTFHQYTGRWDTAPRYSVELGSLAPKIAEASRYYRLAFRDIARATDERTMIAFIAPPGVVFGHTATVEKAPATRRLTDALALCALFNSFTFDWLVRLKATTHLSLYLLNELPMPTLTETQVAVLAASAWRLSGGLTRDAEPNTLPNAPDMPPRVLRAWLDAFVACCYGLDRTAYSGVLRGFSHRSDADATARCLEVFDALQLDRSQLAYTAGPGIQMLR